MIKSFGKRNTAVYANDQSCWRNYIPGKSNEKLSSVCLYPCRGGCSQVVPPRTNSQDDFYNLECSPLYDLQDLGIHSLLLHTIKFWLMSAALQVHVFFLQFILNIKRRDLLNSSTLTLSVSPLLSLPMQGQWISFLHFHVTSAVFDFCLLEIGHGVNTESFDQSCQELALFILFIWWWPLNREEYI